MGTNYYVRSSGDDAHTGLSWAQAKQTILNILARSQDPYLKPGDTVWIAHDTAEDWWPGWFPIVSLSPRWDPNQNNPPSWEGNEDDYVRVISCDDTGDPEPPTTWLAGATIHGNSDLAWNFSGPVYVYGLTFENDNLLHFYPANKVDATTYYSNPGKYPLQPFVAENCTFKLTASGWNPSYMKFSTYEEYPGSYPHMVHQYDYFFKDCTFSLQGTYSQMVFIGYANARFENCTLLCTSGLNRDPIMVRNNANIEFYGCDLSGCPSSKYIIGYAPIPDVMFNDEPPDFTKEVGACHVLINRCKLPSSFYGCFRPSDSTYPFSGDDHLRGEMYYSANSGTPDTRVFQWSSLRGNAFGESTIKRTGGADNGTGGYSIKVVTASVGKAQPGPYFPFCLKPLRFYCFETGTKTFTFEILYDYATKDLTDRDVWIELLHMGAAVPGTVTRSLPHQLSGATLLPDGVGIANWTYTGLTQPKSQKVSVTATIDHEQVLEFQIKVGKAGRTIYIDPLVVVT